MSSLGSAAWMPDRRTAGLPQAAMKQGLLLLLEYKMLLLAVPVFQAAEIKWALVMGRRRAYLLITSPV